MKTPRTAEIASRLTLRCSRLFKISAGNRTSDAKASPSAPALTYTSSSRSKNAVVDSMSPSAARTRRENSRRSVPPPRCSRKFCCTTPWNPSAHPPPPPQPLPPSPTRPQPTTHDTAAAADTAMHTVTCARSQTLPPPPPDLPTPRQRPPETLSAPLATLPPALPIFSRHASPSPESLS